MKRILIGAIAIGLATYSNAQLWDGSSLPPAAAPADGIYDNGVDSYFSSGDVNGAGLTEFDSDSGTEFSLQDYGTKPANIDSAHGWVDASNFALTLEQGDYGYVTYLGKTAGWVNDFGVNLGGMNAYGGGALTLWSAIDNGSPLMGAQFFFTHSDAGPTTLDFWLNSSAPTHGGTYSVFYPESSVPSNSGLPDFDYSALGKVFHVHDSINEIDRSILVIAIEDWRDFDADFTDMFVALEVYDRDGNPQFPVPEPSTYGMIGAMALLGLVAIRRMRRA